MKVLILNSVLRFALIPRKYTKNSQNFSLHLRNEMTGLEFTANCKYLIQEKIYVTILEQPTDFKFRNKYEIELKNGTETLYLGKLIILEQGTDIQNYNYGNSKFSFRE